VGEQVLKGLNVRPLPSLSDLAFLAGGVSFLLSAFLFAGVAGASVEKDSLLRTKIPSNNRCAFV
jgi:hypothetical protein